MSLIEPILGQTKSKRNLTLAQYMSKTTNFKQLLDYFFPFLEKTDFEKKVAFNNSRTKICTQIGMQQTCTLLKFVPS